MRFYIGLIWIWNFIRCGLAVYCYTCNVDFRSVTFEWDNPCVFPPKDGTGLTVCSVGTKYCMGSILRINGAFVIIQRTCEEDCEEYCTEKGYGIKIMECKYCCDEKNPRVVGCGFQGYNLNAAHVIQHSFGWLVTCLVLWMVTERMISINSFKLAL